MGLGASLLEATAFTSSSSTGKPEDVPAPFSAESAVYLSEILHSCSWGCRHKFPPAASAAGL